MSIRVTEKRLRKSLFKRHIPTEDLHPLTLIGSGRITKSPHQIHLGGIFRKFLLVHTAPQNVFLMNWALKKIKDDTAVMLSGVCR
jgi:hypothetical protein